MSDNDNNLQSFIDSRKVKPIEFEVVEDGCADKFLASLRPVERKIVDCVLDAGGFIAGGCPRYVTETIDHMGGYDQVDADAYRHFGDCDLFFPNEESYQVAYRLLVSRRGHAQLSLEDDQSIDADRQGVFAINLEARENDKKGKTLAFQLIAKCQFSDIRTTLARFDILNSMIGFVREDGRMKTVRARGWLQNERSNTLDVLVWDSPLSFYRIQKYIQKYGYQQFKHSGITHDNLMNDMATTMQSLPFDPNPNGKSRMHFGWRNTHRGGEKIVFTQQNYAAHIMSALNSVGHAFPEEVVVFMTSLCMATGIVDDKVASMIIKQSNEIRRDWNPKNVKARVESWKESQRKILAEKAQRKAQMAAGIDVYGVGTMHHRIRLPGGFKGI
jgi:hypothetical protein